MFDEKLFQKYDVECFDYTDYPHKSFWSEEMRSAQYEEALVSTFSDPRHDAVTLYVHIPFCVKLCYFCICHKEITSNYTRIRNHMAFSMHPEIDLLIALFKKTGIRPRVTEVFFGGGSPTILDYAEFDALLSKIKVFVDVAKLDRFCVEVDPRNVTEAKLRFYKSRGVTVVSMGIQDFDLKVQEAINRVQSYELVKRTLNTCRELFTSINFDLLAGLPYQTEASMRETVDKVVELSPDRISFDYFRYNEKFYAHMKLLKKLDAFPDAVLKRKILAIAVEGFKAAGYVRTGFEHFAKPQDRVAQALAQGRAMYTSLGAIAGSAPSCIALGRSGHGIIGDRYLFQNHYDQGQFKQAVDKGLFPVYRGHALTEDDIMRRDIIRRLRTYFALDITEIEQKYSLLSFWMYFKRERELLDAHFVKDGLVLVTASHVGATELGLHFAELIASVFDKYTNAALFEKLDEAS